MDFVIPCDCEMELFVHENLVLARTRRRGHLLLRLRFLIVPFSQRGLNVFQGLIVYCCYCFAGDLSIMRRPFFQSGEISQRTNILPS